MAEHPAFELSYYSYPCIMKLSLFLVLCFTGLVPVAVSSLRTVPHRYELNMTQATWTVAQNYCRVMYTDLAIILNDTDWLRLNKIAKSKGLATAAWVGLYNDVNGWRWSFQDLPLNVTYTYWYSGQPDNNLGKESCVEVIIYGYWTDRECTILKPFICYNANFTDARKFIGVNTVYMTWLGAREYCRKHYTDLASSFNSTDTNYLWKVRDSQGNSWIGLYRDTWKWADGTNASNIQWASGQPNNYYRNENCATVNNNLFSDEQCTKLYNFFCHTLSPTFGQIIKLQVKSDGSLLDPAVQASILELIMQKLEENGMSENATVKWRVQPDGEIFHKKKKDDP